MKVPFGLKFLCTYGVVYYGLLDLVTTTSIEYDGKRYRNHVYHSSPTLYRRLEWSRDGIFREEYNSTTNKVVKKVLFKLGND